MSRDASRLVDLIQLGKFVVNRRPRGHTAKPILVGGTLPCAVQIHGARSVGGLTAQRSVPTTINHRNVDSASSEANRAVERDLIGFNAHDRNAFIHMSLTSGC